MKGKKLTMNAGELAAFFSELDPRIPIWTEWEGVKSGIRIENFSAENVMGCDSLVIDVEDYLYGVGPE